MKKTKTRKTTVKAKTARAKAPVAFYKAPLDFVSNGFNSFVSYFK
jgi:hypothetical protein